MSARPGPATTGADPIARRLAVEAELTGPGAPFETGPGVVLGEPMTVFARRAGSLREYVVNSVGFGDRDYVVFTDGRVEHRLSFVEHSRVVASTAAALRDDYGVGPGDRVAILAANCPEWIVAFWATVSLGAVAVALNAWWVGPEIRYGLDDSAPAVLVADRRRLERLGGRPPGLPTITVEDDFAALTTGAPDADLPDVPIDEDDPAAILYTSGTTGRPKGAVNTHRNMIAAVSLGFFHGLRNVMTASGPASGGADLPPCQLVTYPLFHVSGLHMSAVSYLAAGLTSVWPTGRFDPATVVHLVEQERVTHWSFTPTMLQRVLDCPETSTRDLSSLRSGGGGGAPFPPALLERARAALPNLRTTLGVGYGQTECAALASINGGEELAEFPTSAGRPLPTVELEIRDPLGARLADGELGEICVRGPMVMPGYWNRPEETAAAFHPGRWLRTGDLGHVADGRLYLSARRPDLILRGGENVYPAEVEQRLEEHPGVEEAAVVGVDDRDLGQAVAAFVVARSGHDLDPAELGAWCAAGLAYFKVPTHWTVRTERLPRNAGGKVVKAALLDGELAFVED